MFFDVGCLSAFAGAGRSDKDQTHEMISEKYCMKKQASLAQHAQYAQHAAAQPACTMLNRTILADEHEKGASPKGRAGMLFSGCSAGCRKFFEPVQDPRKCQRLRADFPQERSRGWRSRARAHAAARDFRKPQSAHAQAWERPLKTLRDKHKARCDGRREARQGELRQVLS